MKSNQVKHTPGPWKVTGEENIPHWVQTLDHTPIAGFNFVGDGNQEANARLIASAPELLESLKELANITGERGLDKTVVHSIVSKAWTVIAKAEGGIQ